MIWAVILNTSLRFPVVLPRGWFIKWVFRLAANIRCGLQPLEFAAMPDKTLKFSLYYFPHHLQKMELQYKVHSPILAKSHSYPKWEINQ